MFGEGVFFRMMARRTIAVLLFAAVVPASFAGFRAGDLAAPEAFAAVSARTALLANSMLGSESGLSRWLSFDSLNAQSFANVDLNADIGSPASTIAPIPPLPSSGNLALVALASIGVYQAGRSLRKLNFAAMGHLPDWYHTGARSQVGNATPLPLDFSLFASPLGDLEVQPDQDSSTYTWIDFAVEYSLFRDHETYLRSSIPRGPPG